MTKAEAMEDQVLFGLFSYITQDYLPKGGTTHSGPATTINQQNALQACPQASLVEEILQSMFPPPKTTLVCVKLTKITREEGRAYQYEMLRKKLAGVHLGTRAMEWMDSF